MPKSVRALQKAIDAQVKTNAGAVAKIGEGIRKIGEDIRQLQLDIKSFVKEFYYG
jgi:hypothetical protein